MRKTAAVIMLILGIVLSLAGLTALAGGAVAMAVGTAQGDGFFTTGTARLSVPSHALTSPRLDAIGEGVPPQLPFDVGTMRLRAASVDPGKDIFIGIAPSADVDKYLAGVYHSELLDVEMQPFRAEYRDIPGTSAPALPARQTFWAASATGPGQQELTWDLAAGSWSIVLMNADASQGVSATLQAGARSGLIRPAATGLLVGGALALVVGVPLLIFGAMGLGRHARTPAGPGGPGGPAVPGVPGGPGMPYGGYAASPGYPPPGIPPAAQRGPSPAPGYPAGMPRPRGDNADAMERAPYPARLTGELDPGLSRGLWLVKWFLAIPHVILLIFLWFAFVVATIVAGFAILFTGRYPRALFDFNVGVMRWNWRVAFYAYSAAGTDRYPPFTLARTGYPADFEVEYPERLSRGLVLVKWWLLAIPHLLIVAALAGTAWTWRAETTDLGTTYERTTGISLLGILVLVALVALLFTGRYQRPLFDLILGINRWIYRVMAYTVLMRDEYPPFRLDQGPQDAPPPASPVRQEAPAPGRGSTPGP
ncbi:DUF4389 domain-containing protein [Arthrobacter sp. BHU FT2]|nr:DUF4389 domain-containing protein [Arthrobacter sp. BHU FT2]